ncbi:hypothetical protein KR018_004741 [Drosophila ironensis]|nr:hypothetical protein KR018_004741 [Drosophila ironensis]
MHAAKVIFVLGLALAVARAGIPGGVNPLEGAKLEAAKLNLTNVLAKLASGDGPNYQVVSVKSATTQVVAGSLETFDVELSNGTDKKNCIVKIWEQPWLPKDGTKVTIKCPNEPDLEKVW